MSEKELQEFCDAVRVITKRSPFSVTLFYPGGYPQVHIDLKEEFEKIPVEAVRVPCSEGFKKYSKFYDGIEMYHVEEVVG